MYEFDRMLRQAKKSRIRMYGRFAAVVNLCFCPLIRVDFIVKLPKLNLL